MIEEDRLFSMLERLENKVDSLGSQVATLNTSSHVVTERLGHMAGITQEHLSADRLVHDSMNDRIKVLEEFRTGWRARVATVGATVGALIAIPIAVIVAIIKDMMNNGPSS